MNIEKVYLFLRVVHDEIKSESKTDWTFSFHSPYDGKIYNSDFNGLVSGFSSRMILYPDIKNELWKSNVEQMILYENQSVNHKTYTTVCYLLKPNILQDLFFNENIAKDLIFQSRILSELLIETFPDLTEMARICYIQNNEDNKVESEQKIPEYKLLFKNLYKLNSSKDEHYIDFLDSFLIIVPTNDEFQSIGNQQETIADFLLRFETSVNRVLSDNVYIPYYYLDFIETKNKQYVFLTKNNLRILLCYKPNGVRNKIVIPDSIQSLLAFEIKLHVLSTIKAYLKKVYANRDDIQNYIALISEKDVYKNYTSKFKNERLEYFQTKFEVEETISKYKLSIQDTVPYNLKNYFDKFLIKDISRASELYSWSFLKQHIYKFDDLVSSIELTLKAVETKDSFINTYLNDIISVESIWSNLKLQKTIKRLTYIAIIIATMSILITLYSTEIKSFIEFSLLPLIKHL